MHMDIAFPNMGIYLEHVGKNITIGSLTITYYGIVIGIGMLLGMLLAVQIAKRTGQNTDTYFDVTICSIIFGIIGARIYYVVFSWDTYKNDLLKILNLRLGGLAIFGGLIGAALSVFLYSRIKKKSFLLIMDTIVPGVALGQAIGRWGNFFNREAFGEYTDSIPAMRLPVDAVYDYSITDLMEKNSYLIDGVQYIQVHPTFLYESLWNLGVCIFLVIMTRYRKNSGEIFLLYCLGYCLGRVWIEGLRTDQLIIGNTGIPVSQLLSGVVILVSGILFILLRRKGKKTS